MSERQESGRTYVYRAFSAAGGLLYVGMTNDIVKRMDDHQRTHWIWDVESLTAVAYATRVEAIAAERHAIRTEHPRWNVEHATNKRERSLEYWAWERKRLTPEWPTHTGDEWTVLSRKLRRLTWPIQYGVTLQPLDEAGEFIY